MPVTVSETGVDDKTKNPPGVTKQVAAEGAEAAKPKVVKKKAENVTRGACNKPSKDKEEKGKSIAKPKIDEAAKNAKNEEQDPTKEEKAQSKSKRASKQSEPSDKEAVKSADTASKGNPKLKTSSKESVKSSDPTGKLKGSDPSVKEASKRSEAPKEAVKSSESSDNKGSKSTSVDKGISEKSEQTSVSGQLASKGESASGKHVTSGDPSGKKAAKSSNQAQEASKSSSVEYTKTSDTSDKEVSKKFTTSADASRPSGTRPKEASTISSLSKSSTNSSDSSKEAAKRSDSSAKSSSSDPSSKVSTRISDPPEDYASHKSKKDPPPTRPKPKGKGKVDSADIIPSTEFSHTEITSGSSAKSSTPVPASESSTERKILVSKSKSSYGHGSKSHTTSSSSSSSKINKNSETKQPPATKPKPIAQGGAISKNTKSLDAQSQVTDSEDRQGTEESELDSINVKSTTIQPLCESVDTPSGQEVTESIVSDVTRSKKIVTEGTEDLSRDLPSLGDLPATGYRLEASKPVEYDAAKLIESDIDTANLTECDSMEAAGSDLVTTEATESHATKSSSLHKVVWFADEASDSGEEKQDGQEKDEEGYHDRSNHSLTEVHYIPDSSEPPEVPARAFENLQLRDKSPSPPPPPPPARFRFTLLGSTHYGVMPNKDPGYFERLQREKVAFSNIEKNDSECRVSIFIDVLNVAFVKRVSVRYSTDYWKQCAERDACWITMNTSRNLDRYVLFMDMKSQYLYDGMRFHFAVRYQVDGQEFWDNNQGRNYTIACDENQIGAVVVGGS